MREEGQDPPAEALEKVGPVHARPAQALTSSGVHRRPRAHRRQGLFHRDLLPLDERVVHRRDHLLGDVDGDVDEGELLADVDLPHALALDARLLGDRAEDLRGLDLVLAPEGEEEPGHPPLHGDRPRGGAGGRGGALLQFGDLHLAEGEDQRRGGHLLGVGGRGELLDHVEVRRWVPFSSSAATSPTICFCRAFRTSAADGTSLRLSLVRAVFSISCSCRYSRGVTNVTAIPERPARPVRPIRWMYPSGLCGML